MLPVVGPIARRSGKATSSLLSQVEFLPSCLTIDGSQYLWSQLGPTERKGWRCSWHRLKDMVRIWQQYQFKPMSSAHPGVCTLLLQIKGAGPWKCFPGQSAMF